LQKLFPVRVIFVIKQKIKMKNISIGKVYTHKLDEWEIFWESNEEYRHWCLQKHPQNSEYALVVMLNPGSLSSDGKNLRKDATLRILREVFQETGLNPFIINLFDYATPSPKNLFQNWHKKDAYLLVYGHLKYMNLKGVLYAYGDYEYRADYGNEIKQRISLVKNEFGSIPEIIIPLNNTGTPKHPLVWQRQKLKIKIKQIIKDFNKYGQKNINNPEETGCIICQHCYEEDNKLVCKQWDKIVNSSDICDFYVLR
jgi:hypothetical protein